MDTRGQATPGGVVAWFVGFAVLFFGGALLLAFLRTQAVDPLVTFAENMEWSSTQSTEGLRVFKDWLDLLVVMAASIAVLYFISRAYTGSRGRF